MLAARHRMRRRTDFSTALRGRRAGARHLAVALHVPEDSPASPSTPPLVGFVVSRAVGGATARNRVRRRLRHVTRAHVDHLPDGARLVVRALPPAATATSAALAADLVATLGRVIRSTCGAGHRR